ncbi:MAG: PAS domain-containing protein [Alphaproteobacteria bacterium]|nr:PAS domain-containing protein [Alphaproteobacteria bacterium]
MYFKLNKKIIYIMLCLLVIMVIIFLTIFTNLYSQKLQDNQNSVYIRNQYVVSLLYDKVRMQKQLAEISSRYPDLVSNKELIPLKQGINTAQQELSNEQRLSDELRQNYDNNREAIITGAKIVGISALFVVFFILLMLFLLDYWVIVPVEKLIKISNNVSAGIFSSRLELPKNRYFKDEFDILFSTFNKMLDNTEQNIEESKLRELFLQQLIDAIPDGVRVIDKNFNVIMVNRAFGELLNIKRNCIGGKCYEAYGYENCEGCPISRYNCPVRHFKENTTDLHTIHEVGKIPLYVNASRLIFGKNKQDFYIVEAVHDLSGDVRFSHQQKVSSLAFLSTSIAHEMKNNLGAIRLILEGLLDASNLEINKDENSRKYLTMAYNQLVETVKTPERLLKLARYSETENTLIDVKSAVKDMMLMIDYEAKRRGIVVSTDISDDLSFSGNEADFKMMILNLAQNAIKAMPDGGELKITGLEKSANMILRIKDTGIGIDEKQIKHIFEPFYSANSHAKSSGLGLAIVSSLVEKNSGKISVKSKIGKGTEFTIKIPLKVKRISAKKS